MARYDYTNALPDLPFKSDGCSGGLSKWWRELFGQPTPIEPCCFAHDIEYHYGAGRGAGWWQNYKERSDADIALLLCCLGEYGFKRLFNGQIKDGLLSILLAIPVYAAVRIGGGAYWPTTYKWGFGWTE